MLFRDAPDTAVGFANAIWRFLWKLWNGIYFDLNEPRPTLTGQSLWVFRWYVFIWGVSRTLFGGEELTGDPKRMKREWEGFGERLGMLTHRDFMADMRRVHYPRFRHYVLSRETTAEVYRMYGTFLALAPKHFSSEERRRSRARWRTRTRILLAMLLVCIFAFPEGSVFAIRAGSFIGFVLFALQAVRHSAYLLYELAIGAESFATKEKKDG